MKIRSAIMISGALALMLVSGCQSSPEPESAPAPAAGQSGTVEASEPEYSADLELTVTFPDKTVYTSTDNGAYKRHRRNSRRNDDTQQQPQY